MFVTTVGMKKLTPLERAIKQAGSQGALALAIGVSQQAISYWFTKNGKTIPAEMVVAVEKATGIPRHELRPDVFRPERVGA